MQFMPPASHVLSSAAQQMEAKTEKAHGGKEGQESRSAAGCFSTVTTSPERDPLHVYVGIRRM